MARVPVKHRLGFGERRQVIAAEAELRVRAVLEDRDVVRRRDLDEARDLGAQLTTVAG